MFRFLLLSLVLIFSGCRSTGRSKPIESPIPTVCPTDNCVAPLLPPDVCTAESCQTDQKPGFMGNRRPSDEEAPRNTSLIDDQGLQYEPEFFSVGYLFLPPKAPDPVLSPDPHPDSAWTCQFQTRLKPNTDQSRVFEVLVHIDITKIAGNAVCSTNFAFDGKTYDFQIRRARSSKSFDFRYNKLSSELWLMVPILQEYRTSIDFFVSGRDRIFLDSPAFTVDMPGCDVKVDSPKPYDGQIKVNLTLNCQDGERERKFSMKPKFAGDPPGLTIEPVSGVMNLLSKSCQNRNGSFYAMKGIRIAEFTYQDELICFDDIDKTQIFQTSDYDVLPLRGKKQALIFPRKITASVAKDFTGVRGSFRATLFPATINHPTAGNLQVLNDRIVLFQPYLPLVPHLPRNFPFSGFELFNYCNGGCTITAFSFELINYITTANTLRMDAFFCGYYDQAQTKLLPVMEYLSESPFFGLRYAVEASLEPMLNADKASFNWDNHVTRLQDCR